MKKWIILIYTFFRLDQLQSGLTITIGYTKKYMVYITMGKKTFGFFTQIVRKAFSYAFAMNFSPAIEVLLFPNWKLNVLRQLYPAEDVTIP